MRELTFTKAIGKVTVTVTTSQDIYGYELLQDQSKFCNFRYPSKGETIVHYSTMSALTYGSHLWRDELGRICQAPDTSRNSHFYKFVLCSNADCTKYAIQDAKRLRDFESGEWEYIIYSCSISLNGVEIASNSSMSVESDSDESGHHECQREAITSALDSAREWLKGLQTK